MCQREISRLFWFRPESHGVTSLEKDKDLC